MALKRIIRFLPASCQIGVLLFAWALPVFGDIAAAERAYQNGDYSTAFFGCRMKRLPKYSIDFKNQSLTCDSNEAAKWYRMAAQQGDAGSQRELGQMCLEGRGVPQSDAEALKWLHMAADQGEADAQLNLARMYKDGRGVPQDFIQAHMWANLAASRALTGISGLSPDDVSDMRRYYTALRDQLAAMMTPEQLAQA